MHFCQYFTIDLENIYKTHSFTQCVKQTADSRLSWLCVITDHTVSIL